MQHKVSTTWRGNMQFEAEIGNHRVIMDASHDAGGHDLGVRPKQLMLAALAGCTGMDVVSILQKMRVNIDRFSVDVIADVTEDHPKHYTAMHIIYYLKGNDIDLEKVKKAVELSQERYCGVSAVYRKALKLTYEIKINE
ncbi:MAG: OsmC family protein [Bacteroidales bacterium]|nr:OsmC family protein [Bacteroidales bacterium]